MLDGKRIAIPESREQLILSRLLSNRGAQVVEVPLVAILDAPDPALSVAWLQRFIAQPPDLLILLTGEGLRRLLSLAEREALKERFIEALAGVAVLSRGPKPERVLRDLGLKASFQAQAPTTAGVIASLQSMPLKGHRVAVQLYGEEPNLALISALEQLQASVDCVAPYIYASQEDELKVAQFIQALGDEKFDVLAFTSQPQLHRLLQVAKAQQLEQVLDHGLRHTVLAAVGPVVKKQLEDAGYEVKIMPERVYFMKPLVLAMQRYFEDGAQLPYNQAT